MEGFGISSISNNPFRIDKNFISVRGLGSDVLLIYKNRADQEAKAVIDLIVKLHELGKIARYSDITILLRSVRTSAAPYISNLRKYGIPFSVTGDKNLFHRKEIIQFLELVDFLGVSFNWADKYLRNPLMGLSASTRMVLQDFKGNIMDKSSDLELASIGIKEYADKVKILEILNLKAKVKAEEYQSLLEIFYHLIAITDCIYRFELAKDYLPIFNLGSLSGIFASWDEIGQEKSFLQFRMYLDLLKQGGRDSASDMLENAVNIMSIHNSKGLEFPVVVIGSAINGRLPITPHESYYDIPYHLRASGQPEVEDPHLTDERKLFYVAATRSRDLLIVGTSDIVNKKGDGPSIFVNEMFGNDLKNASDSTNAYIDEVESRKVTPFGPRPRFSFSQLAYYIQCPMRYKLIMYYGFKAPWLEAEGYGTNVHRALEEIHRRSIRGQLLEEGDIENIVSETWVCDRHTTSERDAELKLAAINQLRNYVREYRENLKKALNAEVNFSFPISYGLILGKIDLISKDEKSVEVIDFKTSRTKDLNKDGIEAQLNLYALGAEKCLEYKVAKTTAYFLGDGNSLSASWSSEKANCIESKLEVILKQIKEKDYIPDRSYCDRCWEFRYICPHNLNHKLEETK